MKFSHGVAQFNRAVNNRVQGLYAWLLPPWAVVVHRGRRSGRTYRTPVLGFVRDQTLVIALLYGEESEWLRNLRASPGRLVRAGRTFDLCGEPRVVETSANGELAGLSPPARAYCRLADHQALVPIGGRQPGFGPGPRASR